MKKVDAVFVQMGAASISGFFGKSVYVFKVNGKQVKYHFSRFLAGSTPDMYTPGVLTLDDNDEFVAFDYDGGYLDLNKRKFIDVEIPKE